MIEKIKQQHLKWQQIDECEFRSAMDEIPETEFYKQYCVYESRFYKKIPGSNDEISLLLLYQIHQKLRFFWILSIIMLIAGVIIVLISLPKIF